MLLKQEQLNPCEVSLEIQVELEKVKEAVDKTYKMLGKDAAIDGFRKGKAPRAILEKYLDKERVKEIVADKLMDDIYPKVIDEIKLEPFAPASVDIVELEFDKPMIFKALVPLAPQVELGEYVGLEFEKKKYTVTKEDVDKEIERLLNEHATFPEVTDRGIQKEDHVVIEMYRVDEENDKPQKTYIEVGHNLKDFDDGLMGMKKDEEKEIVVNYPEDFEDENYRGKAVRYHVKIGDIREKVRPELTDEWVKSVFAPKNQSEIEKTQIDDSEKVETVDALKKTLEKLIQDRINSESEYELQGKIIDTIVENSKIDFPKAMVDNYVQEKIKSLMEDLESRNVSLDSYLKYINKTAEQLNKDFEREGESAIKTSLVFGEIVKKEEIKVEKEEIDAEIEVIAKQRNVPAATMRAYIESTNSESSIKNRILNKKIMDFLLNASNIKYIEA
ncbi:MAG: trigger factor [Armatimonadota bacterium]